jgi:hypothetical protein
MSGVAASYIRLTTTRLMSSDGWQNANEVEPSAFDPVLDSGVQIKPLLEVHID